MSFLFGNPEALAAAASDLAGIGSTLNTANAAAAAPTSAVAASAADAVSAQVAAFLSEHGLGYQQFSAQIASFHDQFVQTLSAGANAYTAAEANAAQSLASAVNAPAASLLGGGGGAGVQAIASQASAVGGALSSAVGQVESAVGGSNLVGAAGLVGSNFSGGAQAIASQAGAAGGALSSAVSRVESAASTVVGSNFLGGAGLLTPNFLGGAGLLGGGGIQAIAGEAGALLLQPTAGIKALTAASGLLAPAAMTNAAAVPAALGSGNIGDAIEAAYLAAEPWVQYGFNLAAYAVGYLPWVGILAPQINFLYYLFEPMVQAALFNTIDAIQGSITFAQGLSNFWSVTTASINQFINTEINWVLSFLPPLPPIGVNAP